MATFKIIIEMKVKAESIDDVLEAVDEVLDQGDFQDAIETVAQDQELGPMKILSVVSGR